MSLREDGRVPGARVARVPLEALVAAAATVVLAGWILDLQTLKSLSPSFASMKANTALAFLVAAAALWLLRTGPAAPWRVLAGRAAAALVALVGLLTLAEYALDADLRIDRLLFDDTAVAIGAAPAGRPGANTAFCFVVAGIALLLFDRVWRGVRPREVGAGLVSLVALVALLGYLYEVPRLEKTFVTSQVTPMALHTAIAFLVLAAAMLAARPGEGVTALARSGGGAGAVLRRLLPASIVVVAVLGRLRLDGQEAGLFGREEGLALLATATIVVLVVLSLVTARSLRRADEARDRAHLALRRLNEELEARVARRTEQLEDANRELEAFSYSVSHDLRAPLRAIDGFSRILLEEHADELSEEGRRYLELVCRNTDDMGRLIDGLLTFSRLGQQQLGTRRVDVEELAREVVVELEHERDGRHVEVAVGALPPAQADPTLLRQVLVNLLANAVKYTRTRARASIELGSYEAGGESVYFVRDNGVGFDMRHADKLFQVFQRLHRAEDYEGTGLGLALVARIVARHGGRVWAEGEPDGGAAFYFTLNGKGA